jgi:hypothetical protein
MRCRSSKTSAAAHNSSGVNSYEELHLHERAGNLYAKLGHLEEAHEAYRTAATRCREEHDFLSAARIWDERLSNSAQAILELKAGWPNLAQAVECIRSLFGYFGRLDQHHAALSQIGEMLRQCPQTKQYVRTAEFLSELASGTYLDTRVREREEH